jgi:hypothetical protein
MMQEHNWGADEMKSRLDKTGETESDDAHEERRVLSGLSRLLQARARLPFQH